MTTYTKFKEYIWLVNTIYHAKAITFAEINEHWLKTDMSDIICATCHCITAKG